VEDNEEATAGVVAMETDLNPRPTEVAVAAPPTPLEEEAAEDEHHGGDEEEDDDEVVDCTAIGIPPTPSVVPTPAPSPETTPVAVNRSAEEEEEPEDVAPPPLTRNAAAIAPSPSPSPSPPPPPPAPVLVDRAMPELRWITPAPRTKKLVTVDRDVDCFRVKRPDQFSLFNLVRMDHVAPLPPVDVVAALQSHVRTTQRAPENVALFRFLKEGSSCTVTDASAGARGLEIFFWVTTDQAVEHLRGLLRARLAEAPRYALPRLLFAWTGYKCTKDYAAARATADRDDRSPAGRAIARLLGVLRIDYFAAVAYEHIPPPEPFPYRSARSHACDPVEGGASPDGRHRVRFHPALGFPCFVAAPERDPSPSSSGFVPLHPPGVRNLPTDAAAYAATVTAVVYENGNLGREPVFPQPDRLQAALDAVHAAADPYVRLALRLNLDAFPIHLNERWASPAAAERALAELLRVVTTGGDGGGVSASAAAAGGSHRIPAVRDLLLTR
jgi:hypothetical protein